MSRAERARVRGHQMRKKAHLGARSVLRAVKGHSSEPMVDARWRLAALATVVAVVAEWAVVVVLGAAAAVVALAIVGKAALVGTDARHARCIGGVWRRQRRVRWLWTQPTSRRAHGLDHGAITCVGAEADKLFTLCVLSIDGEVRHLLVVAYLR